MKLALIVLVIVLPLVLIFGTALDVSFNSEDRGGVISYLQDKGELQGFTLEEEEHLEEVKGFYDFIFIIFAISIIIFLICLYFLYPDFNKIGFSLLGGAVLTLAVLFVIYLLTKNWDNAFISFHEIFFKTQWQFPADSLLIKLFPEQFFIDAFRKILLNILFSSVGLIILGVFLWFKKI